MADVNVGNVDDMDDGLDWDDDEPEVGQEIEIDDEDAVEQSEAADPIQVPAPVVPKTEPKKEKKSSSGISEDKLELYQVFADSLAPLGEKVGDEEIAKIAGKLALGFGGVLDKVKGEVNKVKEDLFLSTPDGQALQQLRQIAPSIDPRSASDINRWLNIMQLEQSAKTQGKSRVTLTKEASLAAKWLKMNPADLLKEQSKADKAGWDPRQEDEVKGRFLF